MAHAFRCRKCGHLEGADHAGQRSLPFACRVCHAGLSFSPSGSKVLDEENWEVLHQATDERLAEIGLARVDVVEHKPHTVEQSLAADLVRIAQEQANLEKKKILWAANREPLIADWHKADKRLQEIEASLPKVADDEQVKLHDERISLEQKQTDLEGQEFTARDEAHLKHLTDRREHHEKVLAGLPEVSGNKSQHFVRGAAEAAMAKGFADKK